MEVDVPAPPGDQKVPVLKKFPDSKKESRPVVVMAVLTVLVISAGILTGWLLSSPKASASKTSGNSQTKVESNKSSASANEEGQLDEEIKYQEAEGKLVDGGIKGEGTHHIERDNNPSRYVYLTSTVIDLDKYIDKKVKIWGETISSKNAPWLMDVIKIQVLD